MNLAAAMSLDPSRFTGGLGVANAAMGPVLGGLSRLKGEVLGLAAALGVTASLGGFVAGLKNAFDAGSHLSDEMLRTGQSGQAAASDLNVLKEALQQAN